MQYLIVGAGRSALGATKLLLDEGHKIRVSDREEKFPDILNEMRKLGVDIRIGPQELDLLDGIDALVVSPGLSPTLPLLVAAKAKHLQILSEIDIALARFRGTVLGVTGTNGKSTTTLLLAHFLKAAGIDAEASGNIGIAPSLILSERTPKAFVLELSSYQLDYSQAIPSKVSLFMSFAPDHLERHGSLENYFLAKWKLITATSGLIVLPQKILAFAKKFGAPVPKAPIVQILLDDESPVSFGRDYFARLDSQTQTLYSEIFPRPIQLPGKLELHNQLNVVAAMIGARFLAPNEEVLHSLESFEWLPYRFQKIGTIAGESVYNDSKSTNVESTEIALKSLEKPCVLLLGGAGKGESYQPLLKLRSKIAKLVTFGASAAEINRDLAELSPVSFASLKDALKALPAMIKDQPVPIAFSPANASFDEFANFEERGEYFNQEIKSILDPQNS